MCVCVSQAEKTRRLHLTGIVLSVQWWSPTTAGSNISPTTLTSNSEGRGEGGREGGSKEEKGERKRERETDQSSSNRNAYPCRLHG